MSDSDKSSSEVMKIDIMNCVNINFCRTITQVMIVGRKTGAAMVLQENQRITVKRYKCIESTYNLVIFLKGEKAKGSEQNKQKLPGFSDKGLT